MGTINLHRIAYLVRALDVDALVAHTGGNVAALYAGPVYIDAERNIRATAYAGPGWFEADGTARADTADLSLGPDRDADEVMPLDINAFGEITTAEQIAALIVAQAQMPHPTMTLTRDDVARVLARIAANAADGRIQPSVPDTGSGAHVHAHGV